MKNKADLLNVLLASLPGIDMFSHMLGGPGGARGRSWFDDPKLLARHHRRRRKAAKVRRQLRRVRRARGQNPRTGDRRK